MAVGADRRAIVRLVLRQNLGPVPAAPWRESSARWCSPRSSAGYLFGVTAADPAVLVLVVTVLAGVALVSALLPAMRASRVESGDGAALQLNRAQPRRRRRSAPGQEAHERPQRDAAAPRGAAAARPASALARPGHLQREQALVAVGVDRPVVRRRPRLLRRELHVERLRLARGEGRALGQVIGVAEPHVQPGRFRLGHRHGQSAVVRELEGERLAWPTATVPNCSEPGSTTRFPATAAVPESGTVSCPADVSTTTFWPLNVPTVVGAKVKVRVTDWPGPSVFPGRQPRHGVGRGQ